MSESRFRVGDLVVMGEETAVVIGPHSKEPHEGNVYMSGFYWANDVWWWFSDFPGWYREYASGRVVR